MGMSSGVVLKFPFDWVVDEMCVNGVCQTPIDSSQWVLASQGCPLTQSIRSGALDNTRSVMLSRRRSSRRSPAQAACCIIPTTDARPATVGDCVTSGSSTPST